MRLQFSSLQELQDRAKIRLTEKNKTIEDLQHRIDERETEALKFAQDAERKILDQLERVKILEDEKKELLQQNQVLRQDLIDVEERTKITIECLKNDNEAQRMALSEKDSIIRNVHEQIQKVEQEKESIVIVQSHQSSVPQGDMMLKSEHDRIVKDLNHKLSETTAKHLELTDMQKVYKDELDCLKVRIGFFNKCSYKVSIPIPKVYTC